MDLFMKAFTTVALTQSLGLNPILPVLLTAIIGRYEGFFISLGLPAPVSLPDDLKFITSWWAIGFFLVITVLEAVIDKAQWFDNVKHVTIDPIVSALASAGTTFAVMADPVTEAMYKQESLMNGLPSCLCMTGMADRDGFFWGIMILLILFGLAVTVSFLFIKTALRWVISAIPDMGVSNILISLLEDGIVLISVVLAFFAPVLAVLFTIVLGGSAVGAVLYLKKKADEREKAVIRNLCFVRAVV
ncbi:MAG: DUF4126 domain-containing protein [Candidatus Eremiobacterota bacterium]